MIYAGDEIVPIPVRDLYDKQIMAMSINAARDMYEKGLKLIEDFYTKFGDFISPILKDMDWYNQNVTGKALSLMNYLYLNGIDPLRSAEGRAAISLLIYSMPTGDIAKLRLSAENAKEYIKNRGILQASGKWDPEFERFANLGYLLENWDTIGGGAVWDKTSPAELKTLKEVTEPWYNQRTAHMLDKAGVESFGMQYDPRYNYTGFTEQDLLDIAAGLTPGWNGSIYSDYYRYIAKKQLQSLGIDNPTAKDIELQLQRNVAIANREYKISPIKEADLFALDDYRTKNDIRAHAANAAIDYNYKIKESTDPRLNPDTHPVYNVPEDVYITSLAKAAGLEYLPKTGISPNAMKELLKTAEEKQKDAIDKTHNVLNATGAFIAPQKIAGLILADGKDKDGYFLNQAYFNNLHDLEDIRTSYKGWKRRKKRDAVDDKSDDIRKLNRQRSKDIRSAAVDFMKNNNKGDNYYRLKVVPTVDERGNNTYNMIGEDSRWHTYALVRAYITDGKTMKDAGVLRKEKKDYAYDIPSSGRLLGLEVGLSSNKGTSTPDLSLSAREKLGGWGYFATDDWVTRSLNSGFGFADRIAEH